MTLGLSPTSEDGATARSGGLTQAAGPTACDRGAVTFGRSGIRASLARDRDGPVARGGRAPIPPHDENVRRRMSSASAACPPRDPPASRCPASRWSASGRLPSPVRGRCRRGGRPRPGGPVPDGTASSIPFPANSSTMPQGFLPATAPVRRGGAPLRPCSVPADVRLPGGHRVRAMIGSYGHRAGRAPPAARRAAISVSVRAHGPGRGTGAPVAWRESAVLGALPQCLV